MRGNRGLIIVLLFPALSCYLYLIWLAADWPDEYLFMKTYDDANVKKIVFWTSRFGEEWGPPSGQRRSPLYCGGNVTCLLYSARTHPLRYDALIFHGRDPQRPPSKRSPDQVYIMFTQEAPTYRGDLFIPGDTFYNLTMTYSRTSDFLARYINTRQAMINVRQNNGSINDRTASGRSANQNVSRINSPFNFSNLQGLGAAMRHLRLAGEAMVLWVVGHCETSSRREVYVNALKQHLAVDIYGKCGQDCKTLQQQSGLSCHDFLVRTGKYKFYLSFENSACRDYITEKVYHPLKYGLVPIVYGGLSTAEYTAALPPGSFLDVRNFTSPSHLADYLLYLDKNDEAYLDYHAWRQEWEIIGQDFNVWCDVCHALHDIGNLPPRNVDWGKFWDPETECDSHLLERVLGKKSK